METNADFVEAVSAVQKARREYKNRLEDANAAYVALSQAIVHLETMVEVAGDRGQVAPDK